MSNGGQALLVRDHERRALPAKPAVAGAQLPPAVVVSAGPGERFPDVTGVRVEYDGEAGRSVHGQYLAQQAQQDEKVSLPSASGASVGTVYTALSTRSTIPGSVTRPLLCLAGPRGDGDPAAFPGPWP
jgi:hypothetical protein